jgi:hypothetical protein
MSICIIISLLYWRSLLRGGAATCCEAERQPTVLEAARPRASRCLALPRPLTLCDYTLPAACYDAVNEEPR